MFGCAPKLGLSITPTSNEIIHVLLNEEDLQTHVNDKPSDNTPHNANSNVILYANFLHYPYISLDKRHLLIFTNLSQAPPISSNM
jgi:hypothetical protein